MNKRIGKVFTAVNIIILGILVVWLWPFVFGKKGLIHEKVEVGDGSTYYNIMLDGFRPARIATLPDGRIEYFMNFYDDYRQVVYYYPSGIMKSKIVYDRADKIQGRAYYFYDTSGCLSGDFSYVEGVLTGSAVTYHDSSDHIKEVMYYNNKGELYYRKTFDWQGNLIREEGSK